MTDKEKMDIMLKTMESHRGAIDYRRELQFKTFTWISTFYGIMLAGIVTIMSRPLPIPVEVPLVVGLGALCLAYSCSKFLKQCRASMNRNARNIVSIEEKLGFFTDGYFLDCRAMYAEKSRNWGDPLVCRDSSRLGDRAWYLHLSGVAAFVEKTLARLTSSRNGQGHRCDNCHYLFAVNKSCASQETSFFIIAIGLLCFCVVALALSMKGNLVLLVSH